MSRNKTMKKILKVFSFIVIIIVIFIFVWSVYSTIPTKVRNNIHDADELATSYQHMKLQQFNCLYIEYNERENEIVVFFVLKTSPRRSFSLLSYSPDKCIDDIIMIRDETSRLLKDNPENVLNTKKIKLAFNTYADETMYLYNYNFKDETIGVSSSDFCYYDKIEVHDISKIKEFSNAKYLSFSTDIHLTSDKMDVFSGFRSLEYLKCPKYFSEDSIEYLKRILPECVVTQ